MSDETTRVTLELKGQDNASTAVSGVVSSVGKLTAVMGTLAAVGRIAAGAFNMAEEGAKLQRLADSGSEVARQLGGDMDLIIRKVKEASRGTVSEMDIIASANKAMMLGLGADANQLANLMEIAAFRGRAMGVSTTQAFDDIVRGVGRASPLILDNLGIVVKLGEVNQKYADSIGKTVNELTAAEKKQALLNSVLEEGNKLLEEAGGLADDNASAFEKLNTQMEDNRNRAKSLAADGISPLVSYLADSTQRMNDNAAALERMDEGLYKSYQAHKVLTPEMKSMIAGAERGRAMMDYYGVSVTTVGDAISQTAEEMQAASEANQDFISLVEKMQGQAENFAERYKDINEDMSLTDEERRARIAEVAAEEEAANHRVILSMLEKQLSLDGLSAQETEYLLNKGAEWGIYSETVIEEARKAQDEVQALANEINGIPSEKTIMLNVATNYSEATQAALQLYSSGEKSYGGGRATGGGVSAGKSYLVGERGPEILTMGGSGYVTPNSQLGGSTIVNIMLDSATPDPERVAYNLKPAVERVIREMQQAGRV